MFRHYTSGAAGSMLDGREDRIGLCDFNVFESQELLSLGTATAMPVLLHLFNRFERSLDGSPVLLFIAEAWAAFAHPMWNLRLQSWLRRLRSKNCSVIMDTQSLSDAVASKILPLLNESCPRKIYLPNPQAKQRTEMAGNPGSYELYRILGMNDNQIEIIQSAVPKEHYYVTGPDGARLTTLGLSPFELAVAGATADDDVQSVKALYAILRTFLPNSFCNDLLAIVERGRTLTFGLSSVVKSVPTSEACACRFAIIRRWRLYQLC